LSRFTASIGFVRPLSVTQTARVVVVVAWAQVGVQRNTPLGGFTLAPAGAPTPRLKSHWPAGVPCTEFVMVSAEPGRMLELVTATSTGAFVGMLVKAWGLGQ
jgi:hypothetical protein